jgi:outer membrane protein assembly factor BamB
MGFLMKIITKVILVILISLILVSCGKKILIESYLKNGKSWAMFGALPKRNFFVQDTITLPIKISYKTELRAGLNYSSVTVMDGAIFVGDLKGYVYKIDLNTGRIKNYMNYKQPILTSIIVKENELIIPVAELKNKKSYLIIYNLIQGDEKKEVALEGSIEKDPILDGEKLYLTTTNGYIYKFDKNYNVEWKLDLGSAINSHISAEKDFIVVGTINGKIYFISMDGKILLSLTTNGSLNSGFTIHNSRIYFGDDKGFLYCLDKSGKMIFQKKLGSSIKSIPSIDDKNIFIGDVSGNIYCLDKINGEILWKINYGGLINNSILIVGDKLIVPNVRKKIIIIEKSTGEILQEIEMDGRVKLSPVYVDGKIIVGCDDKKIIALSN